MRKIRKKSVAMPPMPIANNNATIEEVDEAMEAMDGDLPMEKKLANVSNDELFTILGLNIDAKKAVDMTTSFSVKLTDSAEDEQKEFHFALRNGVLERLTRTPEEPSKVTVRTTEDEWRRLIINRGVGEEERLQQIVTDQNQLAELRSILATFDL
jgi:alkyl sulfatase BDS1-like metallo-beta-lactamase superfamily hydrolase